MKALSLWQPWATLIALKKKQIETRSWRTTYRGPLAIHAAKSYPQEARDLCSTEPFYSVLMAYAKELDRKWTSLKDLKEYSPIRNADPMSRRTATLGSARTSSAAN
jgi:hypothetical protein